MSTSPVFKLPLEVLLQCLLHLDAESLSATLSVCSELRTIASQDALWKTHCEYIYNKESTGALGWRKVDKTEILPNNYEDPSLPYYMIWRRMRLCENYLGWWLSLDQGPVGIVMQIKLQRDRLVISHAIPTSDAPAFGMPRGHTFALSWYNNAQNTLVIDNHPVILEEYSIASIRWLFDGPSKLMHHKHALRTLHASNHSSTSNYETWSFEGETPTYDWPSHGSPSLFCAIRHSGISVDEEGYASAVGVPTLAFPRPPGPRPFIALRSPFEASFTESLIDSGTWLASYGRMHGCEFIFIQIRRITEDDLTRPWGTEENIGRAFSRELQDVRKTFQLNSVPPSELSSEDFRVGDRIIEAIKVTGDVNVPRGVRTFVGLLDHPSAWSGPRQDDDFIARPTSHPWPIDPKSEIGNGMPVEALPGTLSEMKEKDVPARGMTLPGLMRVAETGFIDPKWANATIHIANRKEIRVMIQDGHHVATFYKIQKDMFHLIR